MKIKKAKGTNPFAFCLLFFFLDEDLMGEWDVDAVAIKGFFDPFAYFPFDSPLLHILRFAEDPQDDIRVTKVLDADHIRAFHDIFVFCRQSVAHFLHDHDGFINVVIVGDANVYKGSHISSGVIADA